MNVSRYIIFTNHMKRMTEFYTEVMGMTVLEQPHAMEYSPDEWVQLRSGPFELALHKAAAPGSKGKNRNKLVFYAKDVAKERERLVGKGARLGEVKTFGKLQLCDGVDPDGNVIQLSNR